MALRCRKRALPTHPSEPDAHCFCIPRLDQVHSRLSPYRASWETTTKDLEARELRTSWPVVSGRYTFPCSVRRIEGSQLGAVDRAAPSCSLAHRTYAAVRLATYIHSGGWDNDELVRVLSRPGFPKALRDRSRAEQHWRLRHLK